MNSAYPRVPDGTCTGIAQAGAPSGPGQAIDGIASLCGITNSCGDAGSVGFRCSGGDSATVPSSFHRFGTA
ncbi:hypothetical protein L3i22_025660 [Actinoplanes sp. L3-i22]|nr:hypothetical protein L3i22_025660 [Actinoplanes sp. L3-i22]